MLTRNLDEYKVPTTKQAITSFAGLPLLLGMARSLGLEEKLNALPLKDLSPVSTMAKNKAPSVMPGAVCLRKIMPS